MLWLVQHRSGPLLGWVDPGTGKAFAYQPIVRHYRKRDAKGEWLQQAQIGATLEELEDKTRWQSRRRFREDLVPELFSGEVIEAPSAEEARARFADSASVDPHELNVLEAPAGARPGPHAPHGLMRAG